MEAQCTLLQAIARMEGFLSPNSRACRNNNPGNIEYGRFSQAHGATHSDGRFAVFPTAADGFSCMAALFEAHYRGLTVAAALARWAPPNENDTALYARNVCAWTGLSPDTVIDAHLTLPAQVAV